ncbi:MAG: hypothetical protein ACYDBB_21035 [Armatimonadota bacterium]
MKALKFHLILSFSIFGAGKGLIGQLDQFGFCEDVLFQLGHYQRFQFFPADLLCPAGTLPLLDKLGASVVMVLSGFGCGAG